MENVIFNYNIALKLKHFSEFPTAKVHTLFHSQKFQAYPKVGILHYTLLYYSTIGSGNSHCIRVLFKPQR